MTREINDQTPGRPGCDGNDRSRGMSKEIDIAALRKAAQEVITYADSRVPGWQLDELEDKQPRLQVVLPVPVTEIVALLDRLEQAEKDAARYRLLRNGGAAADRIVEDMYEGTLMHEEIDHACDAAMQGEGA